MLRSAVKLYRSDIDGVRAIAFLLIFFYHIDPKKFPGAFIGLDIFFVISGFLITRNILIEIAQTGDVSLSQFYQRRLKRLLPGFLTVVIVVTIVSILVFSPSRLFDYGRTLCTSLFGVSNFVFWLTTNYFDASDKFKPLLHTWSLGLEEQFFLIWPILLLFLWRRFKEKCFWLLASTGVLSLILTLTVPNLIEAANVANSQATMYYLIPFRWFEFVIGGLLAFRNLGEFQVKKFQSDLFISAGFALLLFCYFTYSNEMLYPSYYALVPCLGTAFLVWSGGEGNLSKVLKLDFIQWTGRASYSLYLIHWPIIVFTKYLVLKLAWREYALISTLTLLLAAVNYRYVERPFMERVYPIRNLLKWIGSVVLVLGFLGVSMWVNEGWPWRVGSPIVKFESPSIIANYHKEYYGGAGHPTKGPIGKGGPADIVILGDSHALQYLEGMSEFAQHEDKSVYVVAGTTCLHLPHFLKRKQDSNWRYKCQKNLRIGLYFIRESKQPLVIMAHDWKHEIDSSSLTDESGKVIKRQMELEDLLVGILRFKELIGESQLVLIGSIPKPSVNLYDLFTRPKFQVFDLYYGKRAEDYLVFRPRADIYLVNQFLKKAAKTTSKFVFIDPVEHVCVEDECPVVDENQTLLYSDFSHLSKAGSKYYVQKMKVQLQNLLPRIND